MATPSADTVTSRPYALSLVLAAAMAVSTVAGTLTGILAPYLREDMDLTPARLGVAVAVFAVVSGAMAWPAGLLTDSIGGRRALILVFVGSIVGLVALASAFTYLWLLAAMVAAGFANSATNPATNRVIADWIGAGNRGLVAGIKMAGVQLSVFAAGILVPPAAEAFGWRIPLAVAGASISGLGVLGALLLLGPDHPSGGPAVSRPRFQWSPGLVALTVYSLLMAAGSSSAVTYIPLYTVESLGSTARVGGLAVALIGLLAIAGRLLLGRATERFGRPMRSLVLVAVLALGSAALLLLAGDAGSAFYWVGVAGLGLSALSFIAATTVALIVSMPRDQVGGASGVMFVGFMAGFGGGPALFGTVVEATGGYSPGWALVIGLFALAALAAAVGSKAEVPSDPRRGTDSATCKSST